MTSTVLSRSSCRMSGSDQQKVSCSTGGRFAASRSDLVAEARSVSRTGTSSSCSAKHREKACHPDPSRRSRRRREKTAEIRAVARSELATVSECNRAPGNRRLSSWSSPKSSSSKWPNAVRTEASSEAVRSLSKLSNVAKRSSPPRKPGAWPGGVPAEKVPQPVPKCRGPPGSPRAAPSTQRTPGA